MPTFVSLLRGVNNIGQTRRVPMGELRAVFAGLGYSDVATLLNSGNVVFRARGGTAAKHAANIAAAILEHFQLDVAVIVKPASELTAIVAENPIQAEAGERSRLLVAFAQDANTLSVLARIEPLVVAPERFAIGKRAAYLFCAPVIAESKAGRALLGRTTRSITSRNLATVLKLHALATERDS